MAYLIDTNCFLRLAEPNSPNRTDVLSALKKLHSSGETLCYTPQVLAEFWNVCTRPNTVRGGLGLSVESTERKVKLIEKHFRLLPDNLKTFTEWRRLVSDLKIKGVQVHDARIAASMIAHKISHLLTFNESDFRRYSQITIINPVNV
ncbi:MAG: type II toxin-antitoxin system VapC family toxin [Chloracidobacterium sp.]|nr:type II toxin-antitoxin system VapC family toxin [Chloracidobacterium sp.]